MKNPLNLTGILVTAHIFGDTFFNLDNVKPEKGYMVSLPQYAVAFLGSENASKALSEYISLVKPHVSENIYVSVKYCVKAKRFLFGLASNFQGLEGVVYAAISRNESTIWDVENRKEIILPPYYVQTAGTMTQQMAYRQQVASRIASDIEKERVVEKNAAPQASNDTGQKDVCAATNEPQYQTIGDAVSLVLGDDAHVILLNGDKIKYEYIVNEAGDVNLLEFVESFIPNVKNNSLFRQNKNLVAILEDSMDAKQARMFGNKFKFNRENVWKALVVNNNEIFSLALKNLFDNTIISTTEIKS